MSPLPWLSLVAGQQRQGRPDQPTESESGVHAIARWKGFTYHCAAFASGQRCGETMGLLGLPKIVVIARVRCKLSSGRGCLMHVERGPGQAVCQAQILTAKIWARRLGDEASDTLVTAEQHHYDDVWVANQVSCDQSSMHLFPPVAVYGWNTSSMSGARLRRRMCISSLGLYNIVSPVPQPPCDSL